MKPIFQQLTYCTQDGDHYVYTKEHKDVTSDGFSIAMDDS